MSVPYNEKKIKTNLIKQNCFIREYVRSDAPNSQPIDEYLSLDSVTREDGTGIDLKYSVEEYPITPEYVDSFSEAADYKKDPARAISLGHKRSNLGDITAMQEISSMDTETARALYQQLSKKFGSMSDSNQKSNSKQDVVKEQVQQQPVATANSSSEVSK